MASGESLAERAELVAIQVALARGYLQQQDLREAVSMHQRLQLETSGEKRGLLSVLGDGYLRPEHLPELRMIYEQALKTAGSDKLSRTQADRPSDHGVLHDAPTRGPRKASSGSHAALPGCIGRYELVGELGRGGMGVVYRAHDPALGRDVALKVLAADATAPEERERFNREARAAGQLRHPHVVRVLDVVATHDPPYIVMDLVEGESLKARLGREGPLDPRAAATLVRKLVGALAAAHDLGLVHRDVKPGNILLDAAGEPYLTDFGLVRRADEQRLTRSGDVVGTPHYMSPEQARGDKDIDGRTDLWSVGAVLYQLLVGQPPLKEMSLIEHMKALLNRDPEPPSRARPGVPPEMDAIVMRCLVRDLSARYTDARQLAADLDAFLEQGRPVPQQPGPARGLGLAPIIAALTLFGGVVGVLVVFALSSSPPPKVVPPPPPTPAVVPPPTPPPDAPLAKASSLRLEARRLRDQGSLPEAIGRLDAALAAAPNDLESLMLRAEYHALSEDPVRALADAGRALELDPGSVPTRNLRARLRLKAGDLDPTLDDVERLGPHLDPALRGEVVQVLTARADAQLQTNAAAADADARRALALEPHHLVAEAIRIQALLQLRQFPQIIQIADRLLRDPEPLRKLGALGEVRWGRAQAREQLGRAPEALEDYALAFDELGADGRSEYQCVAAYQAANVYYRTEQLEPALEAVERALALMGRDHPYRTRAQRLRDQTKTRLGR